MYLSTHCTSTRALACIVASNAIIRSQWLWPLLKIPLFDLHHVMWGISCLNDVGTQKSREVTCFSAMLNVHRGFLNVKTVISKVYDYFMKLSSHCTTWAPLKRTFKATGYKAFMWSVTRSSSCVETQKVHHSLYTALATIPSLIVPRFKIH